MPRKKEKKKAKEKKNTKVRKKEKKKWNEKKKIFIAITDIVQETYYSGLTC